MQILSTEREAAVLSCTEQLWRLAADRGINLEEVWREHLVDLPREMLQEVAGAFRRAMDDRALRERGFGHLRLRSGTTRVLRRIARLIRRSVGR